MKTRASARVTAMDRLRAVFERGGWVEIVAVSAARVQEELPAPAHRAFRSRMIPSSSKHSRAEV
jgi:hypothetical protein